MSCFGLAEDEKPVFLAVCPNEHENVEKGLDGRFSL
jgi:hypothetical protein